MVLNQSSLSMWHPPTSESWCCTCHHCWPRPDPTKVWDINRGRWKKHNLSTVWFWNPVPNDSLCVQTFAKLATPRTTWKPPEKTVRLSKKPIWNSLLLPGMAWPTCPTNRCLGLPGVTKLPQTRHTAASEVYSRAVLTIYWLALLHQTPEPQQVPPCHISPPYAKPKHQIGDVPRRSLLFAPKSVSLCWPRHLNINFFDNHEKVGKLPNNNDECWVFP